jgi:hypothetical protein
MSRGSFAERIWWETEVPVFLEKFILPILTTSIAVLTWTNPLKFDWQSRIGLCIGLFALAFVASHQLHLRNEAIRLGSQPTALTNGRPSVPDQSIPSAVTNTTSGAQIQGNRMNETYCLFRFASGEALVSFRSKRSSVSSRDLWRRNFANEFHADTGGPFHDRVSSGPVHGNG